MADAREKRAASILLLEDSPLDAELTVARLRTALEPTVTVARDRRSFETELLARPYDLVLADYALPDFDGITALTLSREKLPHTPFIFISGRVGEEVAIDTLQRGATDYVLKHRLERLVPSVLRALNEADEYSTRKKAEASFRESELRFRQVIDALPQLIWVGDSDGSLRYTNQAWLGYAGSELSTWCHPSLFHPQDHPLAVEAWHDALPALQPFTIELRLLRRSDATYRWHLLRMTPMTFEGTFAEKPQWLGTATDLQDQKLQEEALRTAEKLSVTGRMAAAIAHEINNPLESLTNLLYLVRLESEGNPRALAFLDMTENELNRIASITKQTLQFYRDPVMPVPVDAREILEEVVRLFTSRLTSKGVELTLHIQEGIVFEAIKGEIRQVLINLVNNAIDAVQRRGRIDVGATLCTHNGKEGVEMAVHDNGSGVSAEQADRLFQPFFSTKGAHGTGLGLWVSKGIVEKHGGTIRLQSDGRTSAIVRLPLKAHPQLQSRDA